MGDSRMSWTFNNEAATFWPEWLAEDSNFMNTRIHTWGYYETEIGGRIALSSLKDTGKDLCEAIENSGRITSSDQVSSPYGTS